jgi:SGNH hydrolase-like domain, acetyltransferase AlgX
MAHKIGDPSSSVATTRMLRAFFVGSLAALLVIVQAQSFFPLAVIAPLQENRNPAPRPDLELLLHQNGAAKFADQFNRWIDDRTGFRDLFIRLKNQIDYSLFAVSRDVYIGSNDILFDRLLTDKRFLIDRISERDYQNYLERPFSNFADLLARRGVKLVVVYSPDKSTVYPEYLPPNVINFAASRRMERLRAFLGHQPNIIFIDGQDILTREKDKTSELLFWRTDLHANYRGSISMVRELIRRLAIAAGHPEIAWSEEFQFHDVPWDGGGEARFLATLDPVVEQGKNAENLYRIGNKEPDGHWNVVSPPGTGIYNGSFDYEFVSDPQGCGSKLPATLLFGNSFTDSWWPVGLHKYFCFVRFSRATFPTTRLPAFVETMPSDTKFFVLQFVGPNVFYEAPYVPPDNK